MHLEKRHFGVSFFALNSDIRKTIICVRKTQKGVSES